MMTETGGPSAVFTPTSTATSSPDQTPSETAEVRIPGLPSAIAMPTKSMVVTLFTEMGMPDRDIVERRFLPRSASRQQREQRREEEKEQRERGKKEKRRVCPRARADLEKMGAKIESIKKWTVSTLKNTKQQVLEQLGKTSRTVDAEFDKECDELKDLHRRYGAVVTAARTFSGLFVQLAAAEKELAESLYQLSIKEPTIKTQCASTGETLRKVSDHATSLNNCLEFFLGAMSTLHEKTIQDTMDTMYVSEQRRLEFDVCRNELHQLQTSPTSEQSQIEAKQEELRQTQDKYDRLKTDVRMKLCLLEENRVGVMARQLDRLQQALSAYFSGNAQLLASAVEELAALAPSEQRSFLLQ